MNYKNWRTDGNQDTDLLFLKSYGASKFVVKADISTCFPSIYSHSLSWALVGKDIAKATIKDDSLWYNNIDRACSCMKNGETHGLLIGPIASNLLSEIILTKVDKKLYDKGYRYFRNIDDYECYVDSYETAQCFLHELESTLREYDLPLNYKKTTIEKLPVAMTEKWIHKLKDFIEVTQGKATYKDVNAFLDLALELTNAMGDAAVLKYAVKVLADQNLTAMAKQVAAMRIMHMSIIYPYLVQILEDNVFAAFNVNKDLMQKWADAIYKDSKLTQNYEAISYAIYFSLKYHFTLSELDIAWIIKQGDCVMLLMTWLYYLKLNHGNVRATDLKPLKSEAKRLHDVDMGRYWLFCYEVLPCSSLNGDWIKLKKAGVSFIKPL